LPTIKLNVLGVGCQSYRPRQGRAHNEVVGLYYQSRLSFIPASAWLAMPSVRRVLLPGVGCQSYLPLRGWLAMPAVRRVLLPGVHCAKKKCALVNIFGSVAGITGYDGKGSPIIFTEYSRFAKL
jgi:hypothetical protein